MTQSRFWRSIGTICYALSGACVLVLAFGSLKTRFFPGKGRTVSKEQPQRVVIMGFGSRFIAPTRVDLRDIEGAVEHTSSIFSPIRDKIKKRTDNATPAASPLPAPAAMPLADSKRDMPEPQSAEAVSAVRSTKRSPGKRALVLVSSVLLTAIIATSFLFSVRLFSASLGQSANAQANAAQVVQPTHPQLVRPVFERGIIYPQWYNDGYGINDTQWQQGVSTIRTQTGAQWIEIPVLFSQATSSSIAIQPSASAPSIQSFSEGIERAHSLGYRVFFVPLMQVRESGGWSGSITFHELAQQQAWFDSYWNAILPYASIAASLHVEQMAIGTELQTLQQIVPDAVWNQLIGRIETVFHSTLTYDMNWSSLALPMPTWLRNSKLTYIGVSTYIPLLDKSGRVDPSAIPALWRNKIKTQLDKLAVQMGRQVLLTEIGYRNSSDALYRTWEAFTPAKADPQEQAGAFDAALANVFSDAHIAGTFFWGWDDVGRFAINGQPATQVLLKWYTLKRA